MYNPYMTKQAGIGDALSSAMPMLGGALGGMGAGAGIGGMIGGAAKSIAPIIGAAMGAYAASQVDNAIGQNAAGVDLNGQLATQNGLMNLDQQQMLANDPYAMAGMGLGQPGMGPGMGMGLGQPGMGPGMGPGQGQMNGAGMYPSAQQPNVMQGQDAMQGMQMQKKSAANSLVTDARALVFAYFNQ